MRIHKLVFSPIQVNTYILEDNSGKCAVIDCGCYDRQEFDELQGFFSDRKLEPVLLLNTHCHLDHIFGNKLMLETYGLRTRSSALDEMNRNEAVTHAAIFGMVMDNPPEPESFIEDNQIIDFEGNQLTAIHVPGHTTGSLAFYCREEDCVFTGDALFRGSIGRTDLPGGNYETLMSSIRNRLFVLPAGTVVYPGHGEKTDIKTEISQNPFFLK